MGLEEPVFKAFSIKVFLHGVYCLLKVILVLIGAIESMIFQIFQSKEFLFQPVILLLQHLFFPFELPRLLSLGGAAGV